MKKEKIETKTTKKEKTLNERLWLNLSPKQVRSTDKELKKTTGRIVSKFLDKSLSISDFKNGAFNIYTEDADLLANVKQYIGLYYGIDKKLISNNILRQAFASVYDLRYKKLDRHDDEKVYMEVASRWLHFCDVVYNSTVLKIKNSK